MKNTKLNNKISINTSKTRKPAVFYTPVTTGDVVHSIKNNISNVIIKIVKIRYIEQRPLEHRCRGKPICN